MLRLYLQCLGDQQAALVGQSCFEKGQAKNTLVFNFAQYATRTVCSKRREVLKL
jgi:glycerol kinase